MAKLGTIWHGARGKFAGMSISSGTMGTISHAIPSTVKNPKTEGQQIQRTIYRTVTKSYQFMKEIADHSFQGESGAWRNQAKFKSINLNYLRNLISLGQKNLFVNNCYNFYPEGLDTLLPVSLYISKGSLPQVRAIMQSLGGYYMPTIKTTPSSAYKEFAEVFNLKKGDQVTFVAISRRVGTDAWHFKYARRILDDQLSEDKNWNIASFVDNRKFTKLDEGDVFFTNIYDTYLGFAPGCKTAAEVSNTEFGACGVIISRKINGNWLRSDCLIKMTPFCAAKVFDSIPEGFNIVEAYTKKDSVIDPENAVYLDNAQTFDVSTNIGADNIQFHCFAYTATDNPNDVLKIYPDSNLHASTDNQGSVLTLGVILTLPEDTGFESWYGYQIVVETNGVETIYEREDNHIYNEDNNTFYIGFMQDSDLDNPWEFHRTTIKLTSKANPDVVLASWFIR